MFKSSTKNISMEHIGRSKSPCVGIVVCIILVSGVCMKPLELHTVVAIAVASLITLFKYESQNQCALVARRHMGRSGKE